MSTYNAFLTPAQRVTVQHLPQWARNPGHPWIVSAPGSAKAYQTKPDAERAAAVAHGTATTAAAPPTATRASAAKAIR